MIDSFLSFTILLNLIALTIVFTAPPQGAQGFEERCTAAGLKCICVNHSRDFEQYPGAGLYIDAGFDGTFSASAAPLLFHCPATPFHGQEFAPANSARFCAWPGFWERNTWEIATKEGTVGLFETTLAVAGIKAIRVADIAGLIAPRILCTLINEAAYTIAAGVATAADIDTAMKLGTNYPFGPVEWAQKIGLAGVKEVLDSMALENERYLPHNALQQLAG
jgi:3-hydroxyacyl-CoA dehydrogenase, C-terminal domain